MANSSLATAYVQVIPSAEGIKGSLSKVLGNEAEEAGENGGKRASGSLISRLKDGIKGKIKNILGIETEDAGKDGGEKSGDSFVKTFASKLKTGIAAIGIGAMIKQSLDAGGDLQQSFGGLETIYDKAAGQAKQFASEAAKAGISANTYAEQAVSFGAALRQAYGGDMTQAVGAANTAIMDMADNSAKMGTDIGSLQAAYQGFAKQNYTMLDNLKLGYGGNKTEMERLLADAEKISGIHYDLSNLGDVYSAIHVIQGELNMTGVAADEARHTFTGSMGAMKASAENVMAALTSGDMDVTPQLQQLAQSISDFVFLNLIPMLGRLITGLPGALATFVQAAIPAMIEGAQSMISSVSSSMNFQSVLDKISSGLTDAVHFIHTKFPEMIASGVETITNFANGVFQAMPEVINSITNILNKLVQAIGESFPVILDAGFQLIGNLASGILNNIPNVLQSIASVLSSALSEITEHMPEMLESGVRMIKKLADGILQNLPAVITSIGNILSSLISFIMQNLPTIMQKGVELIGYLAKGIIQNLPAIIGAIAQVIARLIATIAQNLPQFLQKGIELIGQIASGIVRAVPQIIGQIPSILVRIANAFRQYDWLSIGRNIISGIGNGIANAVGGLVNTAVSAAKQLVSNVKGFFGIHSPSTLMENEIGKYLPAGTAKGIEENSKLVNRAMADMNDDIAGFGPVEIPVSPLNMSALAAQQSYGNSRGSSFLASGAEENAGDAYGQNVNVSISINGYNKDKRELAEEIEQIINRNISRRRAAFG